jgi:uncharacterized OB-fold protein
MNCKCKKPIYELFMSKARNGKLVERRCKRCGGL